MGVNASSRKFLELEKLLQSNIVNGHLIGLREKRKEHEDSIRKIDEEIVEYEKRFKEIYDGNDKIMDEDLKGKVYFLVVHEEPYCMHILVRYIDVNIDLRDVDELKTELVKNKNIYDPYLTKDNGMLSIGIHIIKME